MGVVQGEWGTKAKPTVVPSMYEERIVGCICECKVQCLVLVCINWNCLLYELAFR